MKRLCKNTAVLAALFFLVFPSLLAGPKEDVAGETSSEWTLILTPVNPSLDLSWDAAALPHRDLFQSVMSTPEPAEPSIPLNPKSVAILPEAYKRLNRKFEVGKIENSLYTTSLLTLAALNVVDYFSTKEALKYKGLEEGNPLMKPFVKNDIVFAAVKAGFTVLSYHSMKSIYKKDKRLGWFLSIASNLALSYVIANNLNLIQKAKSQGR